MKKKKLNKSQIDLDNCFVEISGSGLRGKHIITLSEMFSMLPEVNPIKTPSSDDTEESISVVEFVDQDVNNTSPPSKYDNISNLTVTSDSKYLYVWVDGRWKRSPLSDF